jgi:hypothetical protein
MGTATDVIARDNQKVPSAVTYTPSHPKHDSGGGTLCSHELVSKFALLLGGEHFGYDSTAWTCRTRDTQTWKCITETGIG